MKQHQPTEKIFDAGVALQMLQEGNERFVQGKLREHSAFAAERKELEKAQNPFAVILTCSDSRVVPEFFFDQKFGDIFVIRTAGNVVEDEVILGSIEYAIGVLKCPLIVVCGHTKCGAVEAACKGHHNFQHINKLIAYISPVVNADMELEEAVHVNVRHVVDLLSSNSSIAERRVVVKGACYNVVTGKIDWL